MKEQNNRIVRKEKYNIAGLKVLMTTYYEETYKRAEKYIAKDENHFTSIYDTVLKRISNIEEEILNTSRLENSKLKEYELDVFENENLHPYWENKLNTLISMGVLK